MKIVVCIKQVPDTVEVKIDPKTGTLIHGPPSGRLCSERSTGYGL